MATAINPADIPTFDDSVVTVPRGESCNTFFISLNQAKKPLDNPAVLQAISYAINKEALIDTFYGGPDYAVVANTWIPPVVPGHKDVLPGYDPEKAKSIIAEAGLTAADLTIDFWYPSDVFRAYMPDPSGLFQALKSDLEAVGFTINPQTKPWRDGYISGIYGGEVPMGIIGWPCDYPTPDNFLDTGMFYYSGGEPNAMFAYKNDELNALMKSAEQMPTIEAAIPTWEKVQDQLAIDMPSVPLIHSVAVAAMGDYVKGYQPSVGVVEHLGSIWLDK
jgi:peptide/nickel transport system substrate-binding protein